jgi:Cys-rich protein (TIGR01571 family)
MSHYDNSTGKDGLYPDQNANRSQAYSPFYATGEGGIPPQQAYPNYAPTYVIQAQPHQQSHHQQQQVYNQQPGAQPVPYYDVQGNLVPYGSACSPQSNGGLLPSPMGVWRTSICDNCCNCEPESWMAWCCNCFSAGQIAGKLQHLQAEVYCLNFGLIVGVWFVLLVLGIILPSYVSSLFLFLHVWWIFIVCTMLRYSMRKRLSIPGNLCTDCLGSFFCLPCFLTQMTHQLYTSPGVTPGCSCTQFPTTV